MLFDERKGLNTTELEKIYGRGKSRKEALEEICKREKSEKVQK
jgi:hypothetical protein